MNKSVNSGWNPDLLGIFHLMVVIKAHETINEGIKSENENNVIIDYISTPLKKISERLNMNLDLSNTQKVILSFNEYLFECDPLVQVYSVHKSDDPNGTPIYKKWSTMSVKQFSDILSSKEYPTLKDKSSDNFIGLDYTPPFYESPLDAITHAWSNITKQAAANKQLVKA